ncbi:MAG: DHHA1 domain-containing protein, partial [Solirubrobacterales bacterium]
ASRLADRHWKPVVLLAVDGDTARGSARGIPGFDLIAALDACAEHLNRHGGHRAAAGLELPRDHLDAFRADFVAHAAAAIDAEQLVRTEHIDALVGVGREGIGMDLAEQLERLAPFGQGNPDPRLIVPSARLRTVRPLGQEGKHSRFDLESGAGRAQGVAFGISGALEARQDQSIDLSVKVEVDRWNGAVQPRVVLRELYPLADPSDGGGRIACVEGGCPSPGPEWWARLLAEMDRAAEGFPPALGHRSGTAPARELVDRRGGAAVAAIAELVSSGEPVLALCVDASRRRALAGSAADPRRFGAGKPVLACCRCGDEALEAAFAAEGAGLVLSDWGALARRPDAVRRFPHVVLVDPPPFEVVEELARIGPGYMHLAWGQPEADLAERCLALEWQPRGVVEQVWRLLAKAGGEARGEDLRSLLVGPSEFPRTPEVAGRCVSVLSELGLCEWTPESAAPALRVLSSEQTQLERSRSYGACVARHEEAKRFQRSRAQSS